MSEGHPLLLDLGPLSCEHTDQALEGIYKALADDPLAAGLWVEYHDPYIAQHLEAVTARGLAILERIHQAVLALMLDHPRRVFGERPVGRLRKALTWARLTPSELDAMRQRLEGKPAEDYTLEDRLLAVDWIISTYLPDGVINSEAEYLAVRAQIAGKIEAQMGEHVPAEIAASLVAALPGQVSGLPFSLSPVESAILDFARVRSAEYITEIGDRTRARIKHIVLDHEQARVLHDPRASLGALESQLRDEFGVLNRDWRRVALTETARCQNEGLIASMEPGTRVKRTEAYEGACPFCRRINGMVFTVVDAVKPDKDGWKEVWLGKTNVGRSASPRRRIGDELVDREPDELWWPAAGVQHPNCRGGWIPLAAPNPQVDPEFTRWLEAEAEKLEREALGPK